jgi:hypothetical protein
MDKVQSLQLLRNKLQDASSVESAAELVHALHYMPLAITQAAAYINRRAHMTIKGYLREFNESSKKKESLLNWETSDLRRDVIAAADFLSLMSTFNPQEIPEPVLRRRGQVAATVGNEEDPNNEFEADVDLLQAYSLVRAMPDLNVCEMHPLGQFCTRMWLSSSGVAEKWKSEFLELMTREFPAARYEDWVVCQQLFPHIEPLFDSKPSTDSTLEAWGQILTTAAWYL